MASPRPHPFVIKPYLQVGSSPRPTALTVIWWTADLDAAFVVAYGSDGGETTLRAPTTVQNMSISGVPHRRYVAVLEGLTAGAPFGYHVLREGRDVFSAHATAPPPPTGSARMALFGDAGDDSGSQRAVSQVVYKSHPDLVLIAGDIVYPDGSQLDYLRNFFPIYNADHVTPGVGVPLMRSVPFVAAPGNHDIPAHRKSPLNLGRRPDLLAFFYDWMMPLNGPLAASTRPPITGPPSRLREFQAASGANFPRMSSYSFDWGAVHWMVLDSNPYVDWMEPALRRWVAADLESARDARWRLVMFHHAPFQSAHMKTQDQWMRLLDDVFEKGRVDIVFSGHLHNYQRTWPLHFEARRQADGRWMTRNLTVSGVLALDHAYDGVRNTRPHGIIYVVSGGGGAPLSNTKRQFQPKQWQPYTCRYVADVWSFSQIDATTHELTVRQIDMNGQEVDRFSISR